MIKQMEIRELYDPSEEENTRRCVDREHLVFDGFMNEEEDPSQDEFFFYACEFLESMEDLDTDYAKIDICYH